MFLRIKLGCDKYFKTAQISNKSFLSSYVVRKIVALKNFTSNQKQKSKWSLKVFFLCFKGGSEENFEKKWVNLELWLAAKPYACLFSVYNIISLHVINNLLNPLSTNP